MNIWSYYGIYDFIMSTTYWNRRPAQWVVWIYDFIMNIIYHYLAFSIYHLVYDFLLSSWWSPPTETANQLSRVKPLHIWKWSRSVEHDSISVHHLCWILSYLIISSEIDEFPLWYQMIGFDNIWSNLIIWYHNIYIYLEIKHLWGDHPQEEKNYHQDHPNLQWTF